MILIGKIALTVWLSFTPVEKTKIVEIFGTAYCEQVTCYKARIAIVAEEETIYFYAECFEREV
jgi:hypothetical protein